MNEEIYKGIRNKVNTDIVSVMGKIHSSVNDQICIGATEGIMDAVYNRVYGGVWDKIGTSRFIVHDIWDQIMGNEMLNQRLAGKK